MSSVLVPSPMMTNRPFGVGMRINAYFLTGVFLILLSLAAASGSVSLGAYQTQTQSGFTSGSYLVYSPLFEAIAIGLAAVGIYFIYNSREMPKPEPKLAARQ